jgi:hypothetical protein
MEEKFIKNYNYACEAIFTNNNRILFLNNLTVLKPLQIAQCLHKTNLKPQAKLPIPKTALEKASVFLYELIKNPISLDKKDSFAFIAFLLFLYEHKYWLKIEKIDLYDLIMWIKHSNRTTYKETIGGINKTLAKYCYKI